MIKRKIKYVNFNKDYQLQSHGDYIDLAISKEYVLEKNSFNILDLGIAMQLPKHYSAKIIPRSSTYKNWRILQANSVGLIDSNYSGMNDRWGFPSKSDYNAIIPKSTRICQFRIELSMNTPWYIKILDLFTTFKFVEVDILHGKDRGGFGGSGL